jgi:hypothetical protein
MFNKNLSQEEDERYSRFAEKSLENNCYSYHFDFDKFSNYAETIVSINIRLTFNKLHLIYLIPYQILKAYWSVVLRRTDTLNNFQFHEETERKDLQKIDEFFPISKVDTQKNFPDLLEDSK